MRALFAALVCVCLGVVCAVGTAARTGDRSGIVIHRVVSEESREDPLLMDPGIRDLYTSSQSDIYCLAGYDFEAMNWQGWTRVDNTRQHDVFWHVDDFMGLGGGSHGGLAALEGNKSMWCGARLDYSDEYMCSWVSAPGYGNDWDQHLGTDVIWFTSPISVSYKLRCRTEPVCDYVCLEACRGGDNWDELARFDGEVDAVETHTLYLATASTKLRFRFISDAACSDQDGLIDTDGAVMVDSIMIADAVGILDYEDFESAAVGDTSAGMWDGSRGTPYGHYSALRNNLTDKDPCWDNVGTQIVFFVGSLYPSAVYPGLFETPFCIGPGGVEAPCQNEAVVSPPIDMTKYSTNCDEVQDADIPPEDLVTLGGAYLQFQVFPDLPLKNLVFFTWSVRSIDVLNECPGLWRDRGRYYYSEKNVYYERTELIGDLIDGDVIQIRLGCVDMCDVWSGVYGNCAAHTPAPWFDNVGVYRFKTIGPQWSFQGYDIFADNFPESEFDLESYIRADIGRDINAMDNPVIRPGDSVVVSCFSPTAGGIDTTPDGRPRVFMHVKCTYAGDPVSPKPALYGHQLAGTYGSYYSDDGSTWTVIQGETARISGQEIAGSYMFDLNDSLLTRGYIVEYYFKAYDLANETSTVPPYAETKAVYLGFSCLPSLRSDILLVPAFYPHIIPLSVLIYYPCRRIIEPLITQGDWIPTLKDVVPECCFPDQYHVHAPASMSSNGPGSRAKNYHLTNAYNTIIWDSGENDFCTISDGTSASDKSRDVQMLIDWMGTALHRTGLWILGDGIAYDLDRRVPWFMNNCCGVTLVNDSYFELTGGLSGGGMVNPKVRADENVGNPLWHATWGDSFYVLGECPSINSFDVLGKIGSGEFALRYPEFGGAPYYAAVYSESTNDGGYPIRTMWFGFSLVSIKDCEIGAPIMRNRVVADVLAWMQSDVNPDISAAGDLPACNGLGQNFPNPFNPVTTIEFNLRERTAVSIKIYNVAGALVRTLVDEVRDAGRHRISWNGTNDSGNAVASGVYFYRMRTREFEESKKLILLR